MPVVPSEFLILPLFTLKCVPFCVRNYMVTLYIRYYSYNRKDYIFSHNIFIPSCSEVVLREKQSLGMCTVESSRKC